MCRKPPSNCKKTTAPLHCRIDAIKNETRDGHAAEQRLFETCNDSRLLAELQGASDELGEATGHRYKRQREIHDLQDGAASDRDEIPHAKSNQRAADLESRVEHAETRTKERQRELI